MVRGVQQQTLEEGRGGGQHGAVGAHVAALRQQHGVKAEFLLVQLPEKRESKA